MSLSIKWLAGGVCVVVGIFFGLGAYTFYDAKGYSYLSNDPKACMNCHIMGEHYDSWIKSSHHTAATCNDCHVPHRLPAKYWVKFDNGWHHSKAFTLQNFKEPIRIRRHNLEVLQNNCIHCHETTVGEILGPHAKQDPDTRCTDCHRSVGHMSLD